MLSKPSVYNNVCRCCNDNVLDKKHPIDLYGPKATKESIVLLLERLTGFKCDINDGLSSKVCRPCYDKIIKFNKFSEKFAHSTSQQQSMVRFKRGKTQGDSPSLQSAGHARKKVAETENTTASGSGARLAFFPSSKPRPILPAPSVTVAEAQKGQEPKRRLLPRGIFPEAPKPKPKTEEILSQSGLHNPAVSENPFRTLHCMLMIHSYTYFY